MLYSFSLGHLVSTRGPSPLRQKEMTITRAPAATTGDCLIARDESASTLDGCPRMFFPIVFFSFFALLLPNQLSFRRLYLLMADRQTGRWAPCSLSAFFQRCFRPERFLSNSFCTRSLTTERPHKKRLHKKEPTQQLITNTDMSTERMETPEAWRRHVSDSFIKPSILVALPLVVSVGMNTRPYLLYANNV